MNEHQIPVQRPLAGDSAGSTAWSLFLQTKHRCRRLHSPPEPRPPSSPAAPSLCASHRYQPPKKGLTPPPFSRPRLWHAPEDGTDHFVSSRLALGWVLVPRRYLCLGTPSEA